MSYNPGTVKQGVRANFDEEAEDLDYESPPIYDSRDDKAIPEDRRVAWLPHSCDLWVIGGPDEVRQMIADLTDVLLKMESKP